MEIKAPDNIVSHILNFRATDFLHFQEKLEIFPEEVGSMLPFTTGAQWKRIRLILTPTFSTGKLKQVSSALADNLGAK